MYSLIIPVYRNEESLPELLRVLNALHEALQGRLEVVFVVDGSPDCSFALLREALAAQPYRARLLLLSRNFGSFAAIRAGLAEASGPHYAVMAADLQEPPHLMVDFFRSLDAGEADVVIGVREHRADPWLSRLASAVYWGMYHRLVQPDVPSGGIDVFGCNRVVRDQLIALDESNTSLVGLLFWLGFRRKTFGYDRLPRRHGESAWSLRRKVRYLFDSVYSFTDLPLRMLSAIGSLGIVTAILLSILVLYARITGKIVVPGYTVIVVVITFFGGLNALGLGIVGGYLWRAYENSKRRPPYIVALRTDGRVEGA